MHRAREWCALLALYAAGPSIAEESPAPGGGGALTVSATPARLVLGRDQVAELRVWGPPDFEDLSFSASTGSIEDVRRLGPGAFAARYRPPPERHPHVAILAAVGRSGGVTLDGWLAVPLSGQGDARVRGQPGSDVSLRIGDRSFGPGRVGDDGIALIPVVVPPGVRQAHRGFTPVDLRVPDTTLLHAVADRATVLADREEAVRVVAYVVAPHGAARRGDAPSVEVTRGVLSLTEREPGAYQGTWRLPPGPAGEERVTLRIEGLPASRVALRVASLPGPATSVLLALEPPVLRAGEQDEIRVTARAQDAAGNPAAGALTVSAEAGTLTVDDAGAGLVRGRLRIDPRFLGREQVVVRARSSATGAMAVQPVALVPGPVARAVLTPTALVVRAGAGAAFDAELELWDRFDNPVPGSPSATASAGAAPGLEPRGTGRWLVRWRPDPATGVDQVRLSAGVAGAHAETELLVLPPRASQVALFAAGGGLTGVSSRRSGGHLLAGAELPLPEPLALPADRALALRLELSASDAVRGSPAGRETVRSAALLAGPVLGGTLPRARWFASGTAGLVVGTAERSGRSSRSGAGLAARLGIGLAVPTRRVAPFAELGFLVTGGPAGGAGALTLSLGIRLDLTRGERSQERE